MKTEMKVNMRELNMNEMEQANGGNILDDAKDLLTKFFPKAK